MQILTVCIWAIPCQSGPEHQNFKLILQLLFHFWSYVMNWVHRYGGAVTIKLFLYASILLNSKTTKN